MIFVMLSSPQNQFKTKKKRGFYIGQSFLFWPKPLFRNHSFIYIFNHTLNWTTKLTMLSHPSYGFSTMGFTNGLITSMIAMNTEGFTEKIRNI